MVIEVGLGGTWDCTNVVHGDVAVLTNFSYDHTDVLGPTLEGIAEDKSGIIEAGSHVVVGDGPGGPGGHRGGPGVERVGAASVWVAGRDFGCEFNDVAVGGRLVTLSTPGGRYPDVLVPLHGAHQGQNAACALAAVEAFFGRPLDPDVVEAAFAAVRVPGRLEVLGRHPLLLVDGAHNVAGMAALGASLAEEFSLYGDTVAVVGMLSGRDPTAMLAAAGSGRRLDGGGVRPRLVPGHPGRGRGPGGALARADGARGARCARRRWRWPGAWWMRTGWWWWPDRSTWSVTRGRKSSPKPCAGRTPGADPRCHPGLHSGFGGGCYCAPLVDRTLVIVKPDGVERGLVGEIVGRLERKGLRLVAAEMRIITAELAETHYAEHAERLFFGDLVAFISRSPSMIMVVEGPNDDTFAVVRHDDGCHQSLRGGTGHHPGRSRPPDDREPRPRIRLARIGRPGDRALLPSAPSSLSQQP